MIKPEWYLGHWKLNGNLTDCSGRGSDVYGTEPIWTKTPQNHTAARAADGQMFRADIHAPDSFTWHGWYCIGDISIVGTLFQNDRFRLILDAGRLRCNYYHPDGTYGIIIVDSDTFSPNQWRFVALSVKKTDSAFNVVLCCDDSIKTTTATNLRDATDYITFAESPAAHPMYVADCGILSKALSVEQLQKIRRAAQPKPNPKPIYFPSKPVITDGLVMSCCYSGLSESYGATLSAAENISVGKGIEFNGSTSKLKYAKTDSQKFTDKLSISFWTKPDTATGTYQYITSQYGDDLLIRFNGTLDVLTIYTHYNESSANKSFPIEKLQMEKWYHFVITMDSNTKEIKVYQDGTLVGSDNTTIDSYGIGFNAQYTAIGYRTSTGIHQFNGKFRNMDFYHKVLSENEVKQIYRTTVPDDTLVLDWSGRDLSRYQASQFIGGSAKIGKTLTGDGATVYARFENNPQHQIDNEITIQFWYKYNGSSGYGDSVNKYYGGSSGYFLTARNGQPQCYIRETSSNYNVVTANATIDIGAWTLITATAQIGDKLKIYINGEKSNEVNVTISTFLNTSERLYIGYYSGYYLNGEITDVKIFSEVKSADWIKAYYESTQGLY